MQITIDLSGDIVERQELLNGTQIVTLEGASADGAWTLVGGLSWNVGLVDYAGEGDMTLIRDDGAEIFGTLTAARVTELDASDGDDADHSLALEYEIDGGAGDLSEAAGTASAEGFLSGDTFRGRWVLSLDSG